MENIEKLMQVNNVKSNVKMQYSHCEFICYNKEFGADQILKIIGFVNEVHRRYKNLNVPIDFYFGTIRILDKLSYIIFECICYWLIKEYRHAVSISWSPENYILTQGVYSSPLLILNTTVGKSSQKYVDKFSFDVYQNHFRRVVHPPISADDNYVGRLQQEVNTFLSVFDIEEKYRDGLVEMVGEIVGNVAEHTKGDCLLDIDVTTDHYKEDEPEDFSYYGVNVVILNFSDILFGDKLGMRIKNGDLSEDTRYILLNDAYNYHKDFFSDNYSFEDFCNLASLQHKISGSPEKGRAGGKGLTSLIESLQNKSDDSACYLLSGKRIVSFHKEFLRYDADDWLGFNESHNFFSEIPDEKSLDQCEVNFPGTAYNLNFVFKREA